MHIGEAQGQNFRKYYETSIARGVDKTFTRLVEKLAKWRRHSATRIVKTFAKNWQMCWHGP